MLITDSQRLKEIRSLLSKTQREMAEALSISQGAYADVERGKNNVSASLLAKLLAVFGVNPAYVIASEGQKFIDKNDHLNDDPNDDLIGQNQEDAYLERQENFINKNTETMADTQRIEALKMVIDSLERENLSLRQTLDSMRKALFNEPDEGFGWESPKKNAG